MFPKDKAGFEMDEQYYIGSSGLLVKPITAKGVTETKVYFAEDQVRDISFDTLTINSSSDLTGLL
jgi:alpha-glucosidase (family GH31 glycosyl hydrolase)